MQKLISIILMVLLLCSFAVAQDTGDESTEDTATGEETTEATDSGDTATSDESASDTDDTATGEEEATDEEVQEVEEEAIDEETEEETELITESTNGAKVRILQLKMAVTKSYLIAAEIISVLKDKGEDVSELEALLAEMEVLKEEVASLDPASESAVDGFVNIKRDIKDLNKQFKKIASPLLSPNDRKAIRDAIKENAELASIKEEIRDTRMNLNANRVGKALERIGASNPELIEKIKAGDATPEEVKAALKGAYSALAPGQKKVARRKIASTLKNRRELRQGVVNRVKEKHLGVRKARLENRLKRIPTDKRVIVKNRIDKKIGALKRVERKVAKNIKTLKKKGQGIKEDAQSTRKNIQERSKNLREKAAIRQNTQERREAIKKARSGGE